MLLALDVGNTNIHLGAFRGAELVLHGDIANDRDRTTDELGLLLTQLLAARGVAREELRGAAIASVVPMVTETVVAVSLASRRVR